MCGQKSKCQKPENLKGKPEECTPEQIKKCHGDVRNHPCETKSSKRQGP
jgi:ArsR family transcriptional regulator